MAENVPVAGFSVPPVPGNDGRPAASSMEPGFVRQAPQIPAPVPAPAPDAGLLTPAQVQEQIAAALALAKPAQAAPPAYDFADTSNDPVLNSLQSVFASVGAGIDIERALGKALTYGDPALIDLAYIKEKGGATADQLAIVAKAIVERVQTQTESATSAVYDTAGGKPQWDAAAATFDQNAPAHLKLVIGKLLDSGNRDAVKQAAQAVVDYVKQNGLVPTGAGLLTPNASGMNSAQALTKEDFQAALQKLDPNARNYDATRQDLFARRSLGKQLGK